MIGDFKNALAVILDLEGGFVNNPADPGGATNKGITQLIYDLYRIKVGKCKRSVKDIEDAEVQDIYKMWYWDKVLGDSLPAAVALVCFDAAVHSGPKKAIQFLDEVLGFQLTDTLSDEVIAASQQNVAETVQNYISLRRAYLTRLNKPAFQKGWMARMDKVAKAASTLI